MELEDNEASRHAEDVCIKLRASITSKTGVPYDTVECIFSSLFGHPKQNHVIVYIENKGSVEVNHFVKDFFSLYDKRRYDTYIPGLDLPRQFEAGIGDWYATIRIAMGIVGDDLTGEWRSLYGSATEVLHIAETACSKYEKIANTVKLPGYKNFICFVTGPDRGYLKLEFILQFESDEMDNIKLTNGDLEMRNTGIGYDLTNMKLVVLSATRY